jgi:uncharacterized protein (DUF2384 family)
MDIQKYAKEGVFDPGMISKALRTTSEEVAITVGLSKDALHRSTRIQAPKTQKRLRELVEVLNKVTPRFGSELIAYAWLRSEPLSGFGGMTAMQLIQFGQAQDVLEYVDAVDAGVYA